MKLLKAAREISPPQEILTFDEGLEKSHAL